MLALVTEDQPTPAAAIDGRSLIDEIVRDGARRMLAAALEAEVAAYVSAHWQDEAAAFAAPDAAAEAA